MKILITGLTLHNNKGGPALALSLIGELKKVFEESEYFLTVPNFKNNLDFEKRWADYYGIDDVFGAIGVKEMSYLNKKRREDFELFFKNIDLVVDLNALSYMDLPTLNYKQNLVRNLSIYTIRYFSNKFNIPCIRWTQSYGPFSNVLTKFLVKRDLKNQKNIFTRGEASFENIQKLLPHKAIYSFPDIAITLKKDEGYYENNLKNMNYVTLSPSSVLYTIEGMEHIKTCREIINYLLKKGLNVVLVPHNLMSISSTLERCDLEVCKEILKEVHSTQVHLVEKDLDVYSLKGIIAKAQLHIGARYHSIIASLSTSVPTIAMVWHEKYKDILHMYTMQKYIFNKNEEIEILFKYIDELETNKQIIVETLTKRQKKLQKEIEYNIKLFKENLNEM